MSYLFTLLFTVVYLYGVWRWIQHQQAGIRLPVLLAAFGFRIVLAVAYGYIFQHYYNGDDTWYFNRGGAEEFLKLQQDPLGFFTELNPVPAFVRNETWALGWYYYLSDLEFWLISKPLGLVHIITGGNYYLNAVFFNAWTFWGCLWLYRFFHRKFPGNEKILSFWLFFFPPLVFWWCGIRGDGLLLFFTALLLTGFFKALEQKKRLLNAPVLIGIAGMLILRSVLLLLWIPALIAAYLHWKKQWRGWKTAAGVYGALVVLFFATLALGEGRSGPDFVIERQRSFFALDGNTRFELDTLTRSPLSFLRIAPQALAHTFVRPHIGEAKGALQWLAAGEALLFAVLLLLFILYRKRIRPDWDGDPTLFYPLLFALSLYLFIGYTIPFPGAIVRYKVQGELFLFLYMTLRSKPSLKHI